MKRRLVWLAAAGHTITDINQAGVPTLLPFFIAEYHLTYAAAGVFMSAASIASSVVQPLFGHFADRFSKSWMMPLGMLLAGYGMAFSGVAPSYGWSLFAVMVSGIGLAAFHPEAARLVYHAVGEKKASGMSLFGIGGQAGFAIGPAIATAFLASWGLKGTLVLTIPVTLMAIVLIGKRSEIAMCLSSSKEEERSGGNTAIRDAWIPFGLLTATVICRSIIFYGLSTFIPLYWIHILHRSRAAGGTALTIMFAAGVIGNLSGGRLADRYGHRIVTLSGFGALIPLLFFFAQTKDVLAATGLLVLIGTVLFSVMSPLVVLGQKYLPNRVGLASGVTLGVAVAGGGVATPLLGRIADLHGISASLTAVACLSVLSMLLALTLPLPKSG